MWRDRSSILVVDDGSSDNTKVVVENFADNTSSNIPIHCIRTQENGGKGAALAFGIKEVERLHPISLILTTDADGSADISGLQLHYEAIVSLLQSQSGTNDTSVPFHLPALVNGYRTYRSASASRLLFRWGFRTVVRLICGDLGVKDSQCGFKLMTTSAASQLYSGLNLKQWSHDVEVFYKARELHMPVSEEPIKWQDKDGSKLVTSPGGVIVVILRMFWDVLILRLSYVSGRWQL